MSWDLHDGPATVRITGVSTNRITYVSADGVHEAVEASLYSTLAEGTRNWRPATTQERTAFDTRCRPAPDQWH